MKYGKAPKSPKASMTQLDSVEFIFAIKSFIIAQRKFKSMLSEKTHVLTVDCERSQFYSFIHDIA